MSYNRWWEGYLIRYLPGTVVSFFVLSFIYYNYSNSFPNSVQNSLAFLKHFMGQKQPEFSWPILITVSFLSFTFCYISSSLVLFLHTFRLTKYYCWCSKKQANDDLAQRHKTLSELKNSYPNYVESYQHLREHGNAFMCCVTSIILGVLIVLCCEYWSWCWGFCIPLMFFTLTGTMSWFYGQWMERKMLSFVRVKK